MQSSLLFLLTCCRRPAGEILCTGAVCAWHQRKKTHGCLKRVELLFKFLVEVGKRIKMSRFQCYLLQVKIILTKSLNVLVETLSKQRKEIKEVWILSLSRGFLYLTALSCTTPWCLVMRFGSRAGLSVFCQPEVTACSVVLLNCLPVCFSDHSHKFQVISFSGHR